ncbi:MAG: hypothetical protein GKS06_08695 [Acidobacteria bacterium]|nr:hypothetical protein [Acidobacteriota bacterium]
MRSSWQAMGLAAIGLMMVLHVGQESTPPAARMPDGVAAKLEAVEQRLPVPYGAPQLAQQFHNAKRLPLDQQIDTRSAYAQAEQQAARMPMYSLAADRLLSDSEARTARRARDGDFKGGWEAIGPTNVGGRARVIVVDPGNAGTLYLGAVSGGVWKTNRGPDGPWKFAGEGLDNVAVNSMAMHPTDSRTLLAGTGEGYFREDVRGTGLPLRGGGIFRTSNAGGTWTQLPGTDGEDFWFVNELVFSPDGARIYAATRTGVHRSADGGTTWTRILRAKEKGGCLDLAIRTDRAEDVLFASCGTFVQASVYRFGDASAKRARAKRVLKDPGMGRTSLALAPSDQNVIYALAASNRPGIYQQALHAVFRSDSGGSKGSWQATVRNNSAAEHNTFLLHNPVLMSLEVCGFDTANTVLPMGWYVNAIAVDPTDPDTVWAGGVDWFRSSDGGQNWGPASYYWAANDTDSRIHADQHVLVFDPGYDGAQNQTVYIGNDGGFWWSDNARAPVSVGPAALCSPANSAIKFTHLGDDLPITQFYQGMAFPDGKSFIGGTQDNGTQMRRSRGSASRWTRVFGGDGGYVAIDPTDPNIFYVQSQSGNVVKTVDGGTTLTGVRNGLPPVDGRFLDPGGSFVFIPPLTMDPQGPERLYLGSRSVFRTNNGAELWVAASAPLKGRATAIAVHPLDSDRVVAATETGFIHVTDAAATAGAATTWPSKRARQAWATWVAFDPDAPDVIYVTYGGFGGKHVFRSVNGGKRWTAIDGKGATGLPDIPVHVIVVDPENTDRLFVGTDLGVFVSTDRGDTWAQENTGFGNYVTESLQLQRVGAKRYLYAFTHGRSAWKVQLKK